MKNNQSPQSLVNSKGSARANPLKKTADFARFEDLYHIKSRCTSYAVDGEPQQTPMMPIDCGAHFEPKSPQIRMAGGALQHRSPSSGSLNNLNQTYQVTSGASQHALQGNLSSIDGRSARGGSDHLSGGPGDGPPQMVPNSVVITEEGSSESSNEDHTIEAVREYEATKPESMQDPRNKRGKGGVLSKLRRSFRKLRIGGSNAEKTKPELKPRLSASEATNKVLENIKQERLHFSSEIEQATRKEG